jgi:TonB family protein
VDEGGSVLVSPGLSFKGEREMDFKSTVQGSYRDPSTAAIISVIPALGQLYNGQTRKGLLFLAVDAINLVLFSILIFTSAFVEAIANFGVINHLKPNSNLKYALLQLHFGSPVSLALTCCLVTFIALAMRDAYDNAANLHRKSLYPGYALELPEATSGSYLFHFSLLALGFILAFFFMVPPAPLRQITEIQFLQNQPKVDRKVIAARKSEHNSENAGERKNREVAPSPPPSNVPVRSTVRNSPPPLIRTPPRPTPVHESLSPKLPGAPMPRPLPVPIRASTAPTAPPLLRPNPRPESNSPPTPIVRPSITTSTNSVPLPLATSRNQNVPMPMPSSSARLANAGTPGPAPVPVAVGSPAASTTAPNPVPVSGRSSNQSGNPLQTPPGPSRSHYSQSGPVLAMGPASLKPMSAARPAHDEVGGPSHSDKPKAEPSLETGESINWGPYMADLQSRIKRAWFPPHREEKRRVVVIFKIHENGELSNLHLSSSSGIAEADKQALAAVENAAPFRHLPKGKTENVDIQFTFDYNVFNGRFRDF